MGDMETNKLGQFIKGGTPWNKGMKVLNNWWSGRKHSEESKKKMSESAKGRISWNKGKIGIHKTSEETRQKLSMCHRGEKAYQWKGGKPKCLDCGKRLGGYQAKKCLECHHKFNFGKNHPNWTGGCGTERHRLMGQKKYILWRGSVFERDLYTCKRCNQKGIFLMAHHIKSWSKYPMLRYKISNGITLCTKCHAKEDAFFAKFLKKGVVT